MEKNPISYTTGFLMVFTALSFDGMQAIIGWIPAFGNILADLFSIFVFLTLFLWFKMHGVQMVTSKRLGSMTGGFIIEMIPYVNLIPAWTAVALYLISTTKIKEVASKHSVAAKAVLETSKKLGDTSRKAA
jgi:hypothetical protein